MNTKTTAQVIEPEIDNHKASNTESTACHVDQLNLTDFINEFKESLLDAVKQQSRPIFDANCINWHREQSLKLLKRQPFIAQKKVIHAITSLLVDKGERAGIINADMGTGKTIMGICIASLMHQEGYQRSLILCPPHLVYKWRREILYTLPGANVIVLNGSESLSRLIRLRNENKKVDCPTFFIIGRVRLRMGFQWKPVAMRFGNRYHGYFAACPDCGGVQKDGNGFSKRFDDFIKDDTKTRKCQFCHTPLWQQVRSKAQHKSKDLLISALCKLPTIGQKKANDLINTFGEKLIHYCLNDNIFQLINLMNDHGEMVFNERQAKRLERSASSVELGVGQGDYQISEFIKRYFTKNYFGLMVLDEAHEYKNASSAQGQAMGVLASCVKKTLLLTGTLMGGYADDLFYLLFRVMPDQMIKDGYRYKRSSLQSAVRHFMELHGIVKESWHQNNDDDRSSDSFKTAKGKKANHKVQKLPGFSPVGIARYLLPYTAFLKLEHIDKSALPSYTEHTQCVDMSYEQASRYQSLKSDLKLALDSALARGDRSLLGVVLNALLAWPDCCFRETVVKHPNNGTLLSFVPTVLDDAPSTKEEAMIELVLNEKANNRRCLIYTIYTGTKDNSCRLKTLLEQRGLKVAVLRSSVTTQKREDWILNKVDQGIDVLICNPELVKTGLDLLDFPTIAFMQTGFNVYTLMQATKRSWRIGQKQPVNVYYFGYNETAQAECMKLMAKKIMVVQSTSGTMPESGLESLNQDDESIEVALARKIVDDEASPPSQSTKTNVISLPS